MRWNLVIWSVAFLIAGLAACSRATYQVAVEESAKMAFNIPNQVKTPDKLLVYMTPSKRGMAPWQFFDLKTNNLVLVSTEKRDINAFVTALREGDQSRRFQVERKSPGTTFFFRCQHSGSTNELHYKLFIPADTNAQPFVVLHAGLIFPNDALAGWLRERNLKTE